MHQLICEPFETRSLSKEKSLTLYDKWSILPADFLYYKYFNDFIRTTRMNAFNLIIEEKQDEIYKENMDNIYIPPYGKEYINDYEYVYWYPADEYFATYSLSPYLARAISNMAAVKNYLIVFIALSTITFFIQYVDSKLSIFDALVNTLRPDFAVADLMAFAYISLLFCIITTIRRWLKKSGASRDNRDMNLFE